MKHKGFTLIEVAVVLVIFTLVATTIFGGRALLRTADRSKLVSKVNTYRVAINAFNLHYNALPGDFKDASDYWSTQCGGAAPAPAGCNGNGNRQIEGDGLPNVESFRFWQHLSLSKIIPGHYTGVGPPYIQDVNMPVAWPSSHALMAVGYITRYGISHNMMYLAINSGANLGAINVEDAYYIDRKSDDGKADSGLVLASDGILSGGVYVPGCTTVSTTVLPTDYNLSLGGLCRLYFVFKE